MEDNCRICLANFANVTLFTIDGNVTDAYLKLTACLHEQVADIQGFPKRMCDKCNIILDQITDFMNTYRKSCNVLEKLIKQENIENLSCDGIDANIGFDSDPDYDVKLSHFKDEKDNFPLKVENEIHVETFHGTQVEVTKHRRNLKTKSSSRLKKPKTNSIAASLLEGSFSWNGDSWCGQAEIKDSDINADSTRKSKLKKARIKKQPEALGRLCDLCGVVFANQRNLQIHRGLVHSHTIFTCKMEKCKFTTKSEKALHRHLQRKHSDDKKFVCQKCNTRFAFKNDLTAHMRKHKMDYKKKTFKCRFCEATYLTKYSVDIHERSLHTGLRPEVCEVCGATFTHKLYLKEHSRLHTGETPYKCPICSKGFAQNGNMKSHIKHNHKLADLPKSVLEKLKPSHRKLLKT